MPKPQHHSNSTAARPLNIPWSKIHTFTCAALLIFVSRLVEAATVYAWLTLHLVNLRCTKAVGTEGAVVVRGLRAQWDHRYASSLASKTLTWHLPSSHVCGKRSSIRLMLPNLLTFGWKVWLLVQPMHAKDYVHAIKCRQCMEARLEMEAGYRAVQGRRATPPHVSEWPYRRRGWPH
jgi:hypothetical protein